MPPAKGLSQRAFAFAKTAANQPSMHKKRPMSPHAIEMTTHRTHLRFFKPTESQISQIRPAFLH